MAAGDVRLGRARRPSRAVVQRRRRAVPPARLAALTTRPVRACRARRMSAVRIQDEPRLTIHHASGGLPIRVELLRDAVLLAGAILAVLVALPVLLEVASAALAARVEI